MKRKKHLNKRHPVTAISLRNEVQKWPWVEHEKGIWAAKDDLHVFIKPNTTRPTLGKYQIEIFWKKDAYFLGFAPTLEEAKRKALEALVPFLGNLCFID